MKFKTYQIVSMYSYSGAGKFFDYREIGGGNPDRFFTGRIKYEKYSDKTFIYLEVAELERHECTFIDRLLRRPKPQTDKYIYTWLGEEDIDVREQAEVEIWDCLDRA